MNNELVIMDYKQDFLNFIDVGGETIKSYNSGVKRFIEYLRDNNISNPTREDVIAFRNKQVNEKSIATANAYLSALKAFFGYLEYNGIYKNITTNVKNVRQSVLPKKQVLTLDQIKEIYNGLTDKREKCIFSLMISTGLRGIEVVNAMIEDIKIHNGENVLWVKCKGHRAKDEYVKLSDKVIEDIKEYIGNRTSGYLFISNSNHNKNGGITTKTLRLIINDILERFGIKSDTLSTHSLRRSFAVTSYENGADIYAIKEVLHHSNISTTSRYIQQINRDNNKTELNVSNKIFGGAM